MRTVEKALRLLDHFDDRHPDFGLSDLARLSGIDKATVLRMLTDLAATGIVEQDPQSRKWRLGAGLLRLARLREAAFPVTRVLTPILERLCAQTGETAHASLMSGRRLGTIGIVESPRSNRVSLEPGQYLPLHTTASGIAFLAFARPEWRSAVLATPLPPSTRRSIRDPAMLAATIDAAARRGFATADQTEEDEVFGIAMPIFGADGYAMGALAVASPTSRVTPAHIDTIVSALFPAAHEASLGLGGRVPPHHRIAA